MPARLSWPRLARLTFSLTERRGKSPCSLRDSGIIATPARKAARGPPGRCRRVSRSRLATLTVPTAVRFAWYTARASSVRPAPTKPARPTISPACRSKDTPLTPGAVSPRTDSTTGASGRTRCLAGNVALTGRPSIAFSSDSSSWPAAAAVRTTCPSRRIVTSSASSSTSSSKCETSTTVVPARASRRMTSCSATTFGPDRAAVGSSITISSALRHSARMISTFCWSAVRRPPAISSPLSSNPAVPASSE